MHLAALKWAESSSCTIAVENIYRYCLIQRLMLVYPRYHGRLCNHYDAWSTLGLRSGLLELLPICMVCQQHKPKSSVSRPSIGFHRCGAAIFSWLPGASYEHQGWRSSFFPSECAHLNACPLVWLSPSFVCFLLPDMALEGQQPFLSSSFRHRNGNTATALFVPLVLGSALPLFKIHFSYHILITCVAAFRAQLHSSTRQWVGKRVIRTAELRTQAQANQDTYERRGFQEVNW